MIRPRSAYDTLGGPLCFPRLLEKIRRHQRGEVDQVRLP